MSQREKSLKVAYLLNIFPVLSETFILNEITELKKQGLDVSIFSLSNPNKGVIHKEAGELARETYYFSNFSDLSKIKKAYIYLYSHSYFFITSPLRYLKTFWFARNNDIKVFRPAVYYALVLRKCDVNHIHVHFAFVASEYAMLISKVSGIPYSFTIHAYDIFLKPRLIKEKVDSARFVVSISQYNNEFMVERYSIDKSKMHVIHCGVNLERFAPCGVRESKGRPFSILSIGRLVEKKGHKYLIEAIAILLRTGICDFNCKIVGDGPLRKDLEDSARTLGVHNFVHFMGAVTNDKVFSLLEEADLFVLPCVVARDGDMDGIPVSLMEAMALEKPVISTYVSGIPELIKDGAGILVPAGDSKALALAIEKIFYLNPEERKERGRKGRELVMGEFNIKKVAKDIKELFIARA